MDHQAIFNIKTEAQFEALALQLFRFQYQNVPVYKEYCDLLHTNIHAVNTISKIPFLPIQFFTSHAVIDKNQKASLTFESSGTTGSTVSKHHVVSLELYTESFFKGFELHYGTPENYTILALLPSYLERGGSSLVYMVSHLIKATQKSESGFYLNDLEALHKQLVTLESQQRPTLLIGVSYALLDFIEHYPMTLNHTLIMETGGMKGRRKELIKEALHDILKKGLGVRQIHSEYGMTELLSQAYSKKDGIFTCPPWMKVLTRDTEDPFHWVQGATGGINIIDLANIYSCAFIATQDLGKVLPDGSFEILGRFDHSDIRGCNLMVL